MPPSSPAPSAPRLRRRLGLFDVLCLGVNAIVGSGVFALPDDMHRAMGGWSPFAFLLCAALLLPVALCFAELSGRTDETGGAYVYARLAFGSKIGFFVGWYCWMNAFVSWAANTTLLVELLGLRGPLGKAACVGAIVALGAVNYVGVKPGAWVVNAVVIGKLSAIFCFLAVALFALEPSRLGGALPHGTAGIGQGIYLALFPLQGFEVTPVPAGETDNPRRNIPLGTVGSLLFAALLFVAVQGALISVYPRLGADAQTPLVDAAAYLGPRVGLIVLVGSFVSIGGFTAGSALGSPRYAKAIADHGVLPPALARVHTRFGTPHVAIVVTTGMTAVLAMFFDYRRLVGMSNITVVIQYVATCLAVLPLRKRLPAGEKAWVIPGGPVIPCLGAAGSLALAYGAERAELGFAAATLALGAAVAGLRWGRGAPTDRAG